MRKVGIIARADNSGLGTMSREFFEHIPCEKTLVVKNGIYQIFPDRFPNARVTKTSFGKEDVDWILSGIDTLVCFETPYNTSLFREAKKKGIKTILIPMYECTPDFRAIGIPDVIICVSDLDYDVYKGVKDAKVIRLNWPVCTKHLKHNQRKTIKTFIHNAGHGGLGERNGTSELLAAIPMVKADVKFIIHSQRQLDYSHPKVEIRVGNYLNYWNLWQEGDVFVFPHKFDGLSLPVQEALASGMPVLSSAIYPFTNWLPPDWLFEPKEVIRTRMVDKEIDYAIIDPAVIARKIDEFAEKDIAREKAFTVKWSEENSWEALKGKYIKIL